MKPIQLITDSSSDISLSKAQELGIHIIPQHVTFGEETYLDRYEITPEQFFEKLEGFDGMPKTSQITVADHMEVFQKYAAECDIIYVSISSKGSGTFQSAHLAAEMVKEEIPDADITILDSMNFTFGYGLWVIKAAEMVKDGVDKQTVIDFLTDKMARTEILFAVDTLEYLQKGGRISPAAKILANVLDIRPILVIEDGLVMSRDKVRGSKKLYPRMLDIMAERAYDVEKATVAVLHVNAPDKAETLLELVKSRFNAAEYVVSDIGACVGVHAGPGAVAVLYLTK
ncbi:MAG: DegV family protein [Ruminococcaceae bacterium]|nr:DegV family protein [Oscillospiraceae bacterium]